MAAPQPLNKGSQSTNDWQNPALSRRSFFKLSTTGGAAILAGGGLSACSGGGETPASGYRILRQADLGLLQALRPVILAKAVGADLPEIADKILQEVDTGLFLASDATRAEVLKLFDLLHMRAARWITTGIWSRWPEAQSEDILEFLDGWRGSHFQTFNAGYKALVKLITASYYGLPESNPSSGYPGPPTWVTEALDAGASKPPTKPVPVQPKRPL